MFEAIEESDEFHKIVRIAEELREEFGIEIDAHPGGVGTEAGVVNRVFRTTARVVLGGVVAPEMDVAVVLTWALRRVALKRLAELGVTGERAISLIAEEPKLGDAWSAYLVLAPVTVIEDLVKGPASE